MVRRVREEITKEAGKRIEELERNADQTFIQTLEIIKGRAMKNALGKFEKSQKLSDLMLEQRIELAKAIAEIEAQDRIDQAEKQAKKAEKDLEESE